MRKFRASLIAFAACAITAGVSVAEEAEPITVDGITFPSVIDYVQSDYFRTQGKRCGTPMTAEDGEAALASPADCNSSTSIEDEYAPGDIWEIQVVVHIITTTSGTGNLTDEKVESQIRVLNEDFRAIAGSLGEDGTDGKVQFKLATVDPDGNPTSGITRTANDTWFQDNGTYWNSLAWDPDRYMNIYTNNPGGGILGYVPFLPHQGTPGSLSDRVVIWYRAFGDPGTLPPYNRGRTATHEVGHYLGMYHTFQNGCGTQSPPGCYASGDRICDTNGESTARFGCPVGATSCGTPDPYENYMDYTDDTCMTNFTPEQMNRIRCTLVNYRPDIWDVLSSVSVEEPGGVRQLFSLYQNKPNPFNPRTTITFELANANAVNLAVLDVSGREVRTFDLGQRAPGMHDVTWDGTNDLAQPVSSGVYFYRISVGNEAPLTRRMVLLK